MPMGWMADVAGRCWCLTLTRTLDAYLVELDVAQQLDGCAHAYLVELDGQVRADWA